MQQDQQQKQSSYDIQERRIDDYSIELLAYPRGESCRATLVFTTSILQKYGLGYLVTHLTFINCPAGFRPQIKEAFVFHLIQRLTEARGGFIETLTDLFDKSKTDEQWSTDQWPGFVLQNPIKIYKFSHSSVVDKRGADKLNVHISETPFLPTKRENPGLDWPERLDVGQVYSFWTQATPVYEWDQIRGLLPSLVTVSEKLISREAPSDPFLCSIMPSMLSISWAGLTSYDPGAVATGDSPIHSNLVCFEQCRLDEIAYDVNGQMKKKKAPSITLRIIHSGAQPSLLVDLLAERITHWSAMYYLVDSIEVISPFRFVPEFLPILAHENGGGRADYRLLVRSDLK